MPAICSNTFAHVANDISLASIMLEALANFGRHDAGDIKKAKEAGYHTCQSLLMQTKKVWIACQCQTFILEESTCK